MMFSIKEKENRIPCGVVVLVFPTYYVILWRASCNYSYMRDNAGVSFILLLSASR